MRDDGPDSAPVFNPAARVQRLELADGRRCVVVDDALSRPHDVVDGVSAQAFAPPSGYPYPGVVLEAPTALRDCLADQFTLRARGALGARRMLQAAARFSMVTTPPAELAPVQWQCHRDRVADDPRAFLFAASVLYLFDDPALGGTAFFRPRVPAAAIDRLLADSQRLPAAAFTARYGVQPGYMTAGSDHFERTGSVPAAWNRLIFYDGGSFHSADIREPARLTADPRRGRLTLNGFFTCRRAG